MTTAVRGVFCRAELHRTALRLGAVAVAIILAAATAFPATPARAAADGNVATQAAGSSELSGWTQTALDLVAKYRQNPVRAARALAIVHLAIEEALARAERAGLDRSLHRLAAHVAAGRELDFLYPREVPGRTVALALIRAGVVSSEAGPQARRLGEDAAQEVVARAMRDGSHRAWDPGTRPEPAEGQWRAAPPLNLTIPVEPLAGLWTPWILPDVDALQLRPPTAYGSAEFWREAREVLEVSRRLTPEHKRIADDWNLDLGTVTPAGVWNLKALELARRSALGERETVRLLAALNTAMADAFIAC